jgi:hypothetical protein
MAWQKNKTDTLPSSNDTLEITALTDLLFTVVLAHIIPTGDVSPTMTLNNDTASVYAERFSRDGATDTTNASAALLNMINTIGNDEDMFSIGYWINITAQEKLGINFTMHANASGAGTAPTRQEGTAKYVNTSDPIDAFTYTNSQAGSYDTDSNITALSTD